MRKSTSRTARREPVIVADHLIKDFGVGDARVRALDDISLQIAAGEYVILFGPSGCGKSTLLNCLAGLEVPTAGRVIIRGEDISKMTPAELAQLRNKKIGLVFQQFNVIKSFNVAKNIALPQLLAGVPRRRRMLRAAHLMQLFNLTKLAKRVPSEISGGQQQRVAIARALANNPWILVVDEPTGNLDSKAADEVMTILDQLNRRSRRTVILVTHNPDYLRFADTVYYLRDGRIVRRERRRRVGQFDEQKFEEVRLT